MRREWECGKSERERERVGVRVNENCGIMVWFIDLTHKRK